MPRSERHRKTKHAGGVYILPELEEGRMALARALYFSSRPEVAIQQVTMLSR
jgi:hypothetical protein